MDGSLLDLAARVRRFRDEREWAPFHNPKDLAVSICLEASELLEIFQWKDPGEVQAVVDDRGGRQRIADELADVLILLLSTAEVTGIDLYDATREKLRKNAEKYPVEKAKGNAKKYDKL